MASDRRLDGKVCLVTGAASGIGRATALAFAREGATVVAADRDFAGAEETVRRATGPGTVVARRLDVTVAAAVEQAVAETVAMHGRLDVLACIAGILLPEDGLVHETDPAVWDRVMDVNLRGTFLCCKYALPQMLAQGGGVIVNTGSTAAVSANICPVYGATKAGVVRLTQVIATQYAERNIRCNAVGPGTVNTPLIQPPAFREMAARFPGVEGVLPGAYAEPEQIAATFVFLASDESSYITGAHFLVDAGATAR